MNRKQRKEKRSPYQLFLTFTCSFLLLWWFDLKTNKPRALPGLSSLSFFLELSEGCKRRLMLEERLICVWSDSTALLSHAPFSQRVRGRQRCPGEPWWLSQFHPVTTPSSWPGRVWITDLSGQEQGLFCAVFILVRFLAGFLLANDANDT